MFGFTIEKLFLIALIAAVVIGPRRLPGYAERLARLIRGATASAREAGRRLDQDSGVAVVKDDWRALDPRQYDPRRIIREAWRDADASPVSDAAVEEAGADALVELADTPAAAPAKAEQPAPSGRWIVTGTSAHPRRVWVADEVVSDAVMAAASS